MTNQNNAASSVATAPDSVRHPQSPLISKLIDRQDRSADFLTFREIENQYQGVVKAGTLSVWACTRRYDFHKLITKVGRKCVVRRDRWESFLESRTAGNAERAAA